jgi:hypothetical protein
MGSKGRYLKKSTKPCWPVESKETWTKYTPTTLLSQHKLTFTARYPYRETVPLKYSFLIFNEVLPHVVRLSPIK